MRSYLMGAMTKLGIGAMLVCLALLLSACVGTMATRTQTVLVKWPQRLSAECQVPSPPNRFEEVTKDLGAEQQKLREVLRNCNDQIAEGRAFEESTQREIDKQNLERK